MKMFLSPLKSSRRKFLMITAAATAGVVTGGASDPPRAPQKTGDNRTGPSLDAILHETTIRKFHRALVAGELSCLQATQWYLERIQKHDQHGVTLNAIVTINPAAEDEARRCDQDFKRGKARGLLHGVPIVIKDNIDVAGLPTTGGCKGLRELVPSEDAVVIKHLRNAGAVILGKANMSEFAWGIHDTIGSALPGFTRNPYNTAYGCGGSSGGTAVAVSANLATVGIGTDTLGSVRVPASINGLVGIRPTFGSISCSGVMPLTAEWDTVGPLARCAEDAAIMLKVMSGDTTHETPIGASHRGTNQASSAGSFTAPPKSPRLGVPRSVVDGAGIDDEVQKAFDAAIRSLRDAGAVVEDPMQGFAFPAFDAMMWYRRFRHDINDYLASHGSRSPYPNLTSLLDSRQIHPWYEATFRGFDQIIEEPEDNPFNSQMDFVRGGLQAHLFEVLNENDLDALAFPTLCYPPRRNGDLLGPPDLVNGLAACAGFPALSVPMGFTQSGLPLGLQLLGRPWSEQRLLEIAGAFETATHHRHAPRI
jgi:amidase